MENFLASTRGIQGTAETMRCPCEPMHLSIGRFEGPNEVQLNSWRRTVNI